MVLKLYGFGPSTCTRRVCTVLEEKGLEYELLAVDIRSGAHKTEEYANEFQPFNKIPVLVDTETGIKVYESRAIAHYIAVKYRDTGIDLSPSEADLKSYADFQQALSIELSYFDPNTTRIAFEKVFKKILNLGPADEDEVKARLEDLEKSLKGYERILSKQKYLAGDNITLADLFHLPYGAMAEPFGFGKLLAKYPATEKWWNGLKERESWKKVNEPHEEAK
ncbi:hypothetical protein CEP54_010860 [Fusarium duplospermum]|uniref:glutathione transferase n=1 Tax=Fusarium duplospermum TaxID=1325734 RepID=A0A428PHQ5_9HYPO|nr:hypothetical protein CEP54_010860 [Fusarium duplospermum]